MKREFTAQELDAALADLYKGQTATHQQGASVSPVKRRGSTHSRR